MAFRSGFFNSVGGDRKYDASFFAEFFASFIGNGVFPNPSSSLQVVEGAGMTTVIKPGKCWINGYYGVNDDDFIIQHDIADGVLKRIDRIVLRWDREERDIFPQLKKGTSASNPVAPSLQRDADAYELAIADVFIGNGATQITQANITDLRLNNDLCGIVHGLVDQVDTTTIFNQYQAWFNSITAGVETDIENWQYQVKQDFMDWFATIQDILDGDVAANLASRITILEQDFAAHWADYVKHPAFAIATGVNNYSVSLDPAPSDYIDGMGIVVAIPNDATGNCTLNVNGLGAKPIKKANGNNVTNLKANGIYTLRYNSNSDSFILQGEGGEYGTALASDVRKGKTFGTEDGIKQGTLDLTNLIPSNVRQGVNIGGVVGNLKEMKESSGNIYVTGHGGSVTVRPGHTVKACRVWPETNTSARSVYALGSSFTSPNAYAVSVSVSGSSITITNNYGGTTVYWESIGF